MPKSVKNKNALILEFIESNSLSSSKEIHVGLSEKIGYATVKRILQKLLLMLSNISGRKLMKELSEIILIIL
jgi:hypothetical protein